MTKIAPHFIDVVSESISIYLFLFTTTTRYYSCTKLILQSVREVIGK